MAVITVEGLTKRFGDVVAVDDLSFEVDQGTVVGFLGPNGAGKTTTLRMLLGLVIPTAGTARFQGRPYRELAAPLRHVGAVLEASIWPPLCSATRRSSSSTSRPTAWIPKVSTGCAGSYVTSRTRAALCWSPATSSPRSPRPSTRS